MTLRISLLRRMTALAVLCLVIPSLNAQPAADPAASVVLTPPAPGPDLLKFTPEEIEAAYAGRRMPEAIRMYLTIVRGGRMTAGTGWFGPSQSRFRWDWLAARHRIQPEQSIGPDSFEGPAEFFPQLDRNQDGRLTADDFDWSESSSWVQQAAMIQRLFRRADPNGDGRLTKEEWLKFFDRTASGADAVDSEQLRDAWLAGGAGSFSPGDAPTSAVLIRGLMAGEVGSLQEGPELDAAAPDFELQPVEGGATIRLSDRLGRKPVVLVFGNFTCGPFRSLYPAVDSIHRRHGNSADFLMIYVREAHPTDGWAMKSNERVGVAVAQPKSLDERRAVADQCRQLLKPGMPLLVDDISDTVGNAWSGMPARLYIIDPSGRIAYKGGRGPFGFKPEEMEQVLVMLLLDLQNATSP